MSIRDLIFKHCLDNNAISKGLAIYQKGEVKNLQQTINDDSISYHAHILNQKAEISLKEEALIHFFCTCQPDKGLCQHGVALLRALNDTLTPTHQVSKKELELAHELMETYHQQQASSFRSFFYHLIPELDLDPYSLHFNLSFKIDINGKRYVIKSLQDFYQALHNKTTLTFGKSTTISANPIYFSPSSQFYLNLIETNCGLSAKINHLRTNTAKIGRYLPLMQSQFDSLFDHILNTNQGMIANAQKESQPYTFSNQFTPDQLKLILKKEGSYYTLTLDGKPISPLGKHYLLQGHTLYNLDFTFANVLFPLLKVQNKHQHSLSLTEEQMRFFTTAILPTLSSHLLLESYIDLSKLHQTAQLKAELFINLPTETSLSAKLYYTYDKIRINPLLNESYPKHLVRDFAREDYYFKLLQQAHFTPNEDEWLLTGENHLYQFLLETLPTLMALNDVDLKVEDRIHLMQPQKLAKQQMNISVTKGIIELSFDESIFPAETLMKIIDTYREGKNYIKLSPSRYLNLLSPEIRELDELLATLGIPTKALKDGKFSLSLNEALTLDAIVLKEHHFDFDQTFENIIKHYKMSPPDYPLPKGLTVSLRSYQKRGYDWLLHLQELGLGGILADDMGLGKTIQSLSYLMKIREKDKSANFLIIVPTSLLYNWESEALNFTPSLKPMIITGDQQEREKRLKSLKEGHLLITSYATLRKDFKYYQNLHFHSIFVDEAQYIKNTYTQNAKATKLLNAKHHFALTGTPIENSLADLWSIMDFANPGYLKTWRHFKHVFEIPITRYEDKDRLLLLQRQIAPFILRRIKGEVAKELPDKIESNLFVTLSEEEKKIYHTQLALSQKTFVEENLGVGVGRIKILALLMRLRQAACSPALFLENYSLPSAKLERALAIVEEKLTTTSQILIFSQFTSMLDLLAHELDKKDIPYLMLTGKTKTKDRLNLVNQFNEEKIPVFLISLKAGGVGLNLTSADTVIHFDPWWNQSVENQATDRTHRIGQDKRVQVIRLIAKDTIEEKILTLKKRKEALASALISGEETFLSTLSSDDLRVLFDLNSYDYH